MPKPKRPDVPSRVPPVSDQLGHLIRSSGRTPSELASVAGIAPSILSRFLRGERGLTSDTVDRIASALGGLRLEAARGRTRTTNPSGAPGAP